MPKNCSYGWKKQKKDPRDYKLRTTKKSIYKDLPSKVDLSPKIDKILNQANTSSCVAHSFAEGARFVRQAQGLKNIDISRFFIYYNTRDIEGTTDQDCGAELRDAAKAVAKYGCPDEHEWPFEYHNIFKKPPENVYNDALRQLVDVYLIVGQTENELKQCLFEGYPILFGTDLTEDFESNEVARTGQVPTPNWDTDKIVGGHAMTIVGYDDSTKQFKVLNHWGSDWGDKGYCYMSYEYILSSHSSDFWTLRHIAPKTTGRKVFVPKAAR